MARIWIVSIGIYGVVSLAWAAPSARAQAGRGTARLAGIVADSADGRPLAGAVLTLSRRGLSVIADQDGRYQFVGLPRDTSTLSVRCIGYGPRTLSVDLRGGDVRLDVRLAAAAIELPTLTVTTGAAATDALHEERATSVMSAADVRRERGQTVGETMKELPGVAIIQYGPGIAKPVVRGIHSQRLRVMNGDVPQEGQQWGAEHAPEIDAFAANVIQVIRGSGFVLYGADAIGGVVRVLPRPLPAHGGVGAELTANLFSNNRQGAASLLFEGANVSLPLIGRVGWRAQGSLRRAGDARTPDYYLLNTGFEERNLNLAVGVTRPWGSSQLSYSRFATTLGMYLGAHVATVSDLERAMRDPLRMPDFSYTIARPNQKIAHDLLAWRADVLLSRFARLDISYGFQLNDRKEFDGIGFASGSTQPAFGLELYTHNVDIRLHHAPLGPLLGTFGVSGLRQGNLSPGRSFLIPQYRLYSGGVYGLEQATFRRWTLSAGLRYDYRWQHAYQFGDPVVLSPDDRRSWDGLSGGLGATFEFVRGWSLASTIGRAWRAPNVAERFSAGVHHGTAQYELGDSSISVERSWNVDATLRHVGRIVRLELSAYHNHIDGYIYLQPFGDVSTVRGAYPGYKYSQTDALIEGLEVGGEVSPTGWWSLLLSGTVVRGRDRVTGQPLFDMPSDRAVATLRVNGSSGRRVAGPYIELGSTLVRRQDHVPLNTVYRLPTAGYVIFGLEAGAASIDVLGRPFQVSVAARNLLNTRYRDYLTRYRLFVDDPARDVVVRIAVPFGPERVQ